MVAAQRTVWAVLRILGYVGSRRRHLRGVIDDDAIVVDQNLRAGAGRRPEDVRIGDPQLSVQPSDATWPAKQIVSGARVLNRTPGKFLLSKDSARSLAI